MTLRTGLIITGDTAGAQKAVQDLTTAINRADNAVEGLEAAERGLEAATDGLTNEVLQAENAIDGLANEAQQAQGQVIGLANAEGVAEAATEGLANEIRQAGGAIDALAQDARQTQGAVGGLAAAEGVAGTATESLTNEVNQAKGAIDALGAEAQQTGTALATLGAQAGRADAQLDKMVATGRGVVRSAGEQALGARMMGQQFQDVGLMIGMSGLTIESVMRAITMQIGQIAMAADQMGVKGGLGRFVGFLNTGLGGAILAVTAMATPFILKLFESGEAADDSGDKFRDAADAADSYGAAQSLVGKIIDLTTGKIRTQNAVLVESIRLQALAGMLQAEKDKKAAEGLLAGYGAPDHRGAVMAGGGGFDHRTGTAVAEWRRQDLEPYNKIRSDFSAGRTTITQAREQLYGIAVDGKVAGQNVENLTLEFVKLGTAINEIKTNSDVISVIDGDKPLPGYLRRDGPKPGDGPKPRAGAKPQSTERRDEFGRDTGDRIAGIIDQYSGLPGPLRQANASIRQLEDLIGDLRTRQPIGWEKMVANANAAKGVVRSGLISAIVEPFDMTPPAIKRASDAMSMLDTVAGQIAADFEKGVIDPDTFKKLATSVADARGVVLAGLDRPFTDYIKNQEQALHIQRLVTQGREDEAEAAQIVFQLERDNAPLAQDRKDAILATVQALRAEQRELDILREKQQIYLNALGDVRGLITQTIYEGADGLSELPQRMFDTFKRFQAEALTQKLFGPMLQELEDQVTGTRIVEDASLRMGAAVDKVSVSFDALGGAVDTLTARMNGSAPGAAIGDPSQAATAAQAMAGMLFDAVEEITVQGRKGNTLKDPTAFFADTLGSTLSTVLGKGLGIKEDSAKAIGGFVGKNVATAMQGAAQGQFSSGIASMLGIKQNSTGAAIGGALGNFIPGLPPGVGSMLGGLVLGTLGGLLDKPKYGTANVGSVYGDVATTGSKGGYAKAAGGLADQVRDGVKSIADRLGGVLGDFDLAIGTWDGKFRVNTFGTDKALHSKNFGNQTLFDFGEDQAAAISFAIADAIKDGGVKGLSAAVQQALRSSSDVQRSLEEATKVAGVEQLLGGLEAEINRAFRDFEREAAERLRIARQYGFDVVALEKRNAEDRLKLSERLLGEQVGSLQRLVDEITHGSMFEGSAVDREAKLRQAIASAEADLNAGKEGAADRVAELYAQLNSVLKQVYGTTGGFAAGQAEIVDKATAAIARANQRIQDAQRTSDPALATTNAALDENNDQNSRILAALGDGNTLMAGIAAALNRRDGGLYNLAKTS